MPIISNFPQGGGGGGYNVETNEYYGTGEYGDASPNTLNLPGEPMVVIIHDEYNTFLGFFWRVGGDGYITGFIRGEDGSVASQEFPHNYSLYCDVNENTLSWHTENADLQLNIDGIAYRYTAFYE